jgi:DNA (cytosine-5)-methyltransferase 1
MNHLGLFEGIGGFSLAARWAGWETVAWCEIDKFCQKVLSYHFPKSQGHEDIKTTDFSIYRGKINVITGGFPCQPYSTAGKRLGKEDERHLWPDMLRAIREVHPQWIVGENVFGLVNWNGGMVFEEVQADLEAEGYEVQPYVLPACGVNAPHRRDRVWFVASNADSIKRPEGWMHKTKSSKAERHISPCSSWTNWKTWDNFPSQSPVCSGDDGLSDKLDNITFSKWRRESIKAYGNAIVPQVAYQIFKAINEYNDKVQIIAQQD